MTALEAYDLTTCGGGQDLARVFEICRTAGSYCLIGDPAVNCYVEPVYTLDAAFVMVASSLPTLNTLLLDGGFRIEVHPHSINAAGARSELRIQFTTDPRYEEFPSRSVQTAVLGIVARVATLEDVTQGKLWTYSDPAHRLSQRKKDELDLIRLAEAYPHLKESYPSELRTMIERG